MWFHCECCVCVTRGERGQLPLNQLNVMKLPVKLSQYVLCVIFFSISFFLASWSIDLRRQGSGTNLLVLIISQLCYWDLQNNLCIK